MNFSQEELEYIKLALEIAIEYFEYGFMGTMAETQCKMRLIKDKVERIL